MNRTMWVLGGAIALVLVVIIAIAAIRITQDAGGAAKPDDKKTEQSSEESSEETSKEAETTEEETPEEESTEESTEAPSDEFDPDACNAWIMFANGDWSVTYSVGDIYDPTVTLGGVVASDTVVTGAGEYTVGLDFTKTAKGYEDTISFAALGISNGMKTYPDYAISIKEIRINGVTHNYIHTPYSTTEDQICTRVNLYNTYSNVDDDVIIDISSMGQIETLEVVFDYAESLDVVYQENFDDAENPHSFLSRSSSEQLAQVADGYSGNALKVSYRGNQWHGAKVVLDEYLTQGSVYYVSTMVKFESDTDTTDSFALSLQYYIEDGTEKYMTVGKAENVEAGTWVQVSGNITIPVNAVNGIAFYVETLDSGKLNDIYIDDFVVAQ